MAQPLSNIRVLDLSRILAGPWATQNLADFGAEVIKVEKPGFGDDTRHMGPPFLTDSRTGEVGDAAYFLSCNRGKKSIAIDFTREEGRALVRALASRSDVLVENYKVGALAKHGLDYESLHRDNPELIYCSVTGFGQTGPYRHRAGYDYLIQAMGGLMSVTGERDDLAGGGPQRVGVAVSDLMTGMWATVAILAALHARADGGGGQHIDISLLDCQVSSLINQGLNYLVGGTAPRRMGSGHPNIAPYAVYPASDGHFILAVGNDTQFRRFCDAVGAPEMGTDPRFATIKARVGNRLELDERLHALTRARTVAEWIALLEAAQVPGGPINDIAQVFHDPQVIARGMRLDLPHAAYGPVPTIRNPVVFSRTPLDVSSAPPVLGQHTADVLRDLDYGEAAVAGLHDRGIVQVAGRDGPPTDGGRANEQG